MRNILKALFLIAPMGIIVAAGLIPMPLRWSVAGMLFGLLFFQLALVGSFDSLLPNSRVYLALREETDQLLTLVRELNAAAIDARRAGIDPMGHMGPIVDQMHESVDRLPAFAGRPADGHLHLTPMSGPWVDPSDEVH